MAVIPLSNGFYLDETVNLSNQDCLNFYPIVVETEGAFNTDSLRSPAGLVSFSPDNNYGACRGAIRFQNSFFTVHGDRFYQVFDSGKRLAIGDPVAGSGRVAMDENGVVIVVIIPGTQIGYFYDSTDGSFKEIDDEAFKSFGDKLDVTYKDGYFVYVTKGEFFWGSLLTPDGFGGYTDKGTGFNALDFLAAEVSTDDNIACSTIRNELYIFGQNSIEVFQTVGGDPPFQRIRGAAVDRGLIARESVIEFQNSYIFIGAGRNEGVSIWRGLAGQSERLSTPSIDNLLQLLPIEDLKLAYAFKYSESGNFFCGFTIPNQLTIVFDETTSNRKGRPIWHRRATSDTSKGTWRPSHIEQVYGRILTCDSIDGRIGELDINKFTDYDEPVLRRFNTIYFQNEGSRFRIPFIELKTQMGIGTGATGANFNEFISMAVSNDGGVRFTNPIKKELGLYPSSVNRAIWRRNGSFDMSVAFQFDVLTTRKINVTKLIAEVN